MSDSVLIVPGYRGSGAAHWQSWLESNLPDSRRVCGIDWDSPVLPEWTREIHREIDESSGRIWIVAHSFGCLASVVVASERAEKVAGVVLVAPADPERFSHFGVRHVEIGRFAETGIANLLPSNPLPIGNNVVIASENDPWLDFKQAGIWATRWGSKIINIGQAGHINTESGFGPWPFLLELLTNFGQEGQTGSHLATGYRNKLPRATPSANSRFVFSGIY